MFSEELQRLINASLTDGVLTDKEREVIRKRALLEGADPDEVDLILDAEVQKLRQKQEAAVKRVKKCPNCGEIIPTIAVRCSTCGYEFREQEANSVVERFAKGMNNALPSTAKGQPSKRADFIRSYVIPNNADDLYEMIIYLTNAVKTDNGKDEYVKPALQQKINECTDKVKMLYPDDKRFANLLTVTKLNFWQKLSSKSKKTIICILCLIVAVVAMKVCAPPTEEEVIQETRENVDKAISNKDYDKAVQLLQGVDKEKQENYTNQYQSLINVYIEDGNIEKAAQLLHGIYEYRQGEFVNQYQAVIKAYIDKDDIESAASLLQGIHDTEKHDLVNQYLYVINAYISKDNIKGAESVINSYGHSSWGEVWTSVYKIFYKPIHDYYIEKGDTKNAERFTPEAVDKLED